MELRIKREGLGLWNTLFVVLAVLKWQGLIEWTWLKVCVPLFIGVLIKLIAYAIVRHFYDKANEQ